MATDPDVARPLDYDPKEFASPTVELRNTIKSLHALNGELALAVTELAERGARLERLIRWLTIPFNYEDPNGVMVFSDPDFAEWDPMTMTALPGNTELKKTWWEVVRRVDLDAPESPANVADEREGDESDSPPTNDGE